MKSILIEKNVRLLLFLKEYCVSEASIKAGLTYSHARKVTQGWEELGVLKLIKTPGVRMTRIEFSEEGKQFVKKLEDIYWFSKGKKYM